jgi:hypothetical protein
MFNISSSWPTPADTKNSLRNTEDLDGKIIFLEKVHRFFFPILIVFPMSYLEVGIKLHNQRSSIATLVPSRSLRRIQRVPHLLISPLHLLVALDHGLDPLLGLVGLSQLLPMEDTLVRSTFPK